MARSAITKAVDDLVSDSGAVLWSFVRGEQLEYPVVLNFIEGSPSNYTFEAVVLEATNISGSEEVPTTVKTGGVQTTLTVRVPTFRGTWNATQAYSKEEVVYYDVDERYYKLRGGAARVISTVPPADSLWEETEINRVYLQFPGALGATWSPGPTPSTGVYGFFELRVTEPNDGIFQRTWKPVRGMIQLQYSPTEVV